MTTADKIRAAGQEQPLFRARDIQGAGDPRSTLRRMVRTGQLLQAGRGLYRLPEVEPSLHHGLLEAAARHPGGVFCLFTALAFHGIGTQIPHAIWMARQDRKAAPADQRVRFVYSTGAAFHHGVEKHRVDGMTLSIYSPAKTIADCFKYRNKIGLDVALEALQTAWLARLFNMDQLWAAAHACRVQRVMQPYMEMLVL